MIAVEIYPHYVPAHDSMIGRALNWQVRLQDDTSIFFFYVPALSDIKRTVDGWVDEHTVELSIDGNLHKLVTDEDWAIAILTHNLPS